jgi:excinuclease ABC subunit C
MLFTPGTFPGFGQNRFDPLHVRSAVAQVSAKRSLTLRKAIRREAPRLPGVYGMLDPRGRLIYVGKAKNLRVRLMSYFRAASRDPKAGRIIAQTRTILWEPGPNEFASLLRELELIRRFRPSFNALGQPGRRRFVYLALGRPPAAYFHLCRESPKSVLAVYGPLPGSRRVGDCVRRLNDHFMLRDCPQSQSFRFADQGQLFPIDDPAGCLRYEIGTCHGPCIAAVTRREYSQSVRAAKAFLDGLDSEPLEELQRAMRSAAALFAFERAATLRDKLADLQWLSERLGWLQDARREYSFVYPVQEGDGPTIWYLIRGGRVLASVRAPRDLRSRRAASRALDVVFPNHGGPAVLPDALYDHVLLVSGWFRRYAPERANTYSIEQARQICSLESVLPMTG